MSWNLIIQFLVLTTLISGVIIFTLYMVLIRTVDGAKQRLDRDAEAARQREAELNQKIKEADEQLARRQKELDVLEKKMRQELEEQTNKQKEEMIQKARSEAEEIITKAQNAKEGIRREIEKNMEIKIVDYSIKVVGNVFTNAAKDALDRQLFAEFMEKLKNVDLSKLGPDVKSVDVITASPLDQNALQSIGQVFKEKLGRELKLAPKIDQNVLNGVILQFGSLLLDGSLQNSFKESASALKQQVEKQYTV
ncbi:MAG: F0F1 ATP synthase subunit delta [Candidatus Omnitrophica bacterium]|nr:F0F1 ATP synthase subunit delta [Candidatus Omnitrophota bacterium]